MKRHREDNNPYGSSDSNEIDSINHSVPKRFATRSNSQSNCQQNEIVNINYSPPNSIQSDSSSSSTTIFSTNNLSNQLCRCLTNDCVIHSSPTRENLPRELTQQVNPIYANKNLLLYYAHLERCRRYGIDFHQNTSSS